MADGNILSDFGIDLLEEEIDDVIFQTNEFLTDATFTGSQGPFWWILQMCMALAALFAIVMAAGMAYKMMVKHEPLDVMKLFRPLAVSLILCWWYPPADTYNPQIQISAESETKRSIFREKDKTKRSKKESAQHSKSRNKSFVMTSVSAL